MAESYTLPRSTVESLTCTAQVVAEHLEHGYVTSADARVLRAAVQDVEKHLQVRQSGLKPPSSQQEMLWGD